MINVLADNTTIMITDVFFFFENSRLSNNEITEVTGWDQSIALLTKNYRLYRVGKPKIICNTGHSSNNKKVVS